jgi:hypothetical protein
MLQLTIQIEELHMAIQNTLVGKLPIAVLKPSFLHNVLRNISFLLPKKIELVVGIKLSTFACITSLLKLV